MLQPKHLSDRALARWTELADRVSPEQADLLAVYCEAHADWSEAAEKIASQGRLVRDAQNRVLPSPWVTVRDNAAGTLKTIGEALGIGRPVDVLPAEIEDAQPFAAITDAAAIAALQAEAGVVAYAARRLGVSRSTFYRHLLPRPAVQAALPAIREAAKDVAERQMWQLIHAGNWDAVKFYLRCQARDRGYVDQVRVEGPDGGPIAVAIAPPTMDLSRLSTEELKQLREISLKAAGGED